MCSVMQDLFQQLSKEDSWTTPNPKAAFVATIPAITRSQNDHISIRILRMMNCNFFEPQDQNLGYLSLSESFGPQ